MVEEARRVFEYRDSLLGDAAPPYLCLALSSRRNLCIHPRVSQYNVAEMVDSSCRALTASWIREAAEHNSNIPLCDYFEVGFISFLRVRF